MGPKLKVGVLLPHPYRGGTLKLLYSVCKYFARFPSVELVVAVPRVGNYLASEDFARGLQGISSECTVCEFDWKSYSRKDAESILENSRVQVGRFVSNSYTKPVDANGELENCDFWFFVSDRIGEVLLPICPYGIFVTDHLHRYFPGIFASDYYSNEDSIVWNFQRNIRNADICVASTEGTVSDVRSYSGTRGELLQVPLGVDVPHFASLIEDAERDFKVRSVSSPYFVWVTNTAEHKNHPRAFQALRDYFANGGECDVVIVGCNTDLFSPNCLLEGSSQASNTILALPYIRDTRNWVAAELEAWKDRMHFLGEVSDAEYVHQLKHAQFLWHNVIADNGTYSIVEAACLGIPSISSDYPQMREIDSLFGLSVSFFDPYDVEETTRALQMGPKRLRIDKAEVESRIKFSGWEYWSDALFTSIQNCERGLKRVECL